MKSRFQITLTVSFLVFVQCVFADGDLPWNIETLKKAPEFKWGEGKRIRQLYYRGMHFKGKPTRVYANYSTPGLLKANPRQDKNLPAVVLIHGGGGTVFPNWVELWASRGYAAVAMDLGGDGPGKKHLPDGFPGQSDDIKFGWIDRKITDQWPYHAVANVILAHSMVLSFPEVDRERTAITGISWGGYLTCIVAGLDDRFKAAVPVYGCGFIHENSCWLKWFEKMSAEHRARWVRLWDPSSYIESTTVPILMVNGGRDFAYPPDSFIKTYDLVKSEKNLHFVPDLKHGHFFGRPHAIEVFIKSKLKKGKPLAKISGPTVNGKKVIATVESKTWLKSATLHYTLDSLPGDEKKRKWLKQPTVLEGKKVTAGLPPAGAKVWFITVEDERNTVVSSRPVFE